MALLAPLPAAWLCAADAAYNRNGLRQFLKERGTLLVIPNDPSARTSTHAIQQHIGTSI